MPALTEVKRGLTFQIQVGLSPELYKSCLELFAKIFCEPYMITSIFLSSS